MDNLAREAKSISECSAIHRWQPVRFGSGHSGGGFGLGT